MDAADRDRTDEFLDVATPEIFRFVRDLKTRTGMSGEVIMILMLSSMAAALDELDPDASADLLTALVKAAPQGSA